MKKTFKYLLIVILGLFTLGQLERIQLTKVVAFYLHDLFITIWVGLIIIKYSQQLFASIKKYFFNSLTLNFFIIAIISLIIHYLSYNFSIIPLLYIGRTLLYLIFGLSLPIVIRLKQNSYHKIWVIIGLITAALGLLQYLWAPDTRWLFYLGWDDHLYRLISTQFDPNFTGIILVISFLFLQDIWHQKPWLKTISSILLAIAILLTYSRASFISFIISSLILIIISRIKSYKTNRILPIMLSAFIILIPCLPRPEGEGVKLERTASISARFESNQSSLMGFKPYQWLIGRGLFTYQPHETDSIWPNTAHFPNNLVVFLINSMGILGTGMACLILWRMGKYLYLRDAYLFSAFIAILIHSQFNHTLFQPFIWLWLCSQLFMMKKIKT